LANSRNSNRRRRMMLLAPTAGMEEAPLSEEQPDEGVLDKAMRSFRAACQAKIPIRLRVTGPGLDEPREFSFEAPYVVIGRNRKADLRLNHPDVPLRDTYLQMVDGRLYCVDLTGSRLVDEDVDDRTLGEKMEDGEALHIGPYVVNVINWSSYEELDVVSSGFGEGDGFELSDELVRANIEVLNSKKTGRRYCPIEDVVSLIGHASGSHVRLKDHSMSKTHCAIIRTPEELWCVDLIGRGGTRLNGAEIRIGRLKDGDLLHIGKAKLRVHYSTMDSQSEPQDFDVKPESQSDLPAGGPPPQSSSEFPAANMPAAEPPETERSTPAAPPENLLNQMMAAAMPGGGLPGNMPATGMPSMPSMPGTAPLPALPDQAQLPQLANNTAERNVSEQFVLSLVNQFGQMQQQLFQQSQQSMMMLVNMFSTLHQNHMDLIRDDLNRLHEVTAELQSVQAQMASSGNESATNVSYTRAAESTETEHVSHEDVQDAVFSEAVPESAKKPQAPQPAPAEEAAASDQSDSENKPVPPPEEEKRQRSDRSGVRTHAMLAERLAELENERNSRWQKIMQTIKSVGGV